MPSVWEEAYGYAGVEFLAKGIPVIANAIGGMPDYTREGETGWLNRSCSAEELARIIAGIVDRPEQVVELNERLIATRDSVVKPMRAPRGRDGRRLPRGDRDSFRHRAGARYMDDPEDARCYI